MDFISIEQSPQNIKSSQPLESSKKVPINTPIIFSFPNKYFRTFSLLQIELFFLIEYNHPFMHQNLSFALLALLVACSATQNVVVVNSGVTTTTVVSPTGQSIGLQPYHNQNTANQVGTGAQWVWISGSASWPDNYVATFQSLFYSDCPQAGAVLLITADNIFNAYLNGVKVGQGSDWRQAFSFKVSLRCGLNNLTVVATNKDAGSPASLIFSITQDQRSCYDCSENPSAVYNRNTCQCECSTECFCPSKLQKWIGYPFCGCKCNKQTFAPCPTTQYWNQRRCDCVCKKKWCLPGQIQDSNTCECVVCPPQKCLPGFAWNPKTCSCEVKICVQTQLCVQNKVWCPTECACVCKDAPTKCRQGEKWDEASCSCVHSC